MEVFKQRNKVCSTSLSVITIVACFLSSFFSFSEQYHLDVLAELPTLDSKDIVALIPVPSATTNSNQYFIANESSEIYRLKGKKISPFANFQLTKKTNQVFEKLTALTLHPSFAISGQPGYQTLFTAHIETAKINNNVARITLLNNPTSLPFDAVITQWQLPTNNHELPERREVLRIAVPSITHIIQKIAFNPYDKAWHDDYGLLHIALSNIAENVPKQLQPALYSGVILRVNPAKFGLRNYTVPNDNPFFKNSDINNEIFILGSQKIMSFHWSKKNVTKLFVQHIYGSKHFLSMAGKGADWRVNHQNKHVSAITNKGNNPNELIFYSGKNLKDLSGSILYLLKSNKGWQLTSLSNPAEQNIKTAGAQHNQTVSLFNNNQLPLKNEVRLFTDHQNEPLLFDITNKQLLIFTNLEKSPSSTKNRPNEESAKETTENESTNAYSTLLLTLFFIVTVVIFYRLVPGNKATKKQLKKQFARFEIDKTKNIVSFYKRHQIEIDSQLAITDIVESELLLNNYSLNIINVDSDNGYSLAKENKTRSSFTGEHRNKLIEDEIRQVHLSLTDNKGKSYIVCMYLRKGNQRFTKTNFFDILEKMIDWNWIIAKQLNPQATEKRKIVVLTSQPATKTVSLIAKKNPSTKPEPVIELKAERTHTNSELHNIAVHDTELINSLDKLANLKQQGFLTEEEFSLAKAKILVDITRNK
ncbi:MAG: SHOCT domain-containing protein [Colwellia sp.]|nr:SHOCT domain-containing protein [Colwellia sp.]